MFAALSKLDKKKKENYDPMYRIRVLRLECVMYISNQTRTKYNESIIFLINESVNMINVYYNINMYGRYR